MRRETFDVAVVGLGAVGGAALWRIARRKIRAVGFDRHTPPHHFGSSHGESRIIRAAYHEHPLYVPLVQRAFALWAELQETAGVPLLARCGGLITGPADGVLVAGAARSARAHGLQHERWSAADIRAHVPALRVPDAYAGVWEPGAGMLAPERGLEAMLAEARRHGAEIVAETTVVGWEADGAGVTIATAAQDYRADRLVLAAGPWIPDLLPELPLPLERERVVQCWFTPADDAARFAPDRFPVFLIEDAAGRLFYGLPDHGHGVKAAFHHEGERVTMDRVRRRVSSREVDAVRRALASWVPGAAGPLRDATVCLYTNTPDGHFLLDRHPGAPQVTIASCCSGHGFKFAPVLGEVLADFVTDVSPPFDLTPFGLARFLGPAA